MFVSQAIFLSFTDLPSDFALALIFSYKQTETAATCPNKQFRHKIHLFFLLICQEEINNVIFVWVYELENNKRTAEHGRVQKGKQYQDDLEIEDVSIKMETRTQKKEENERQGRNQHSGVFVKNSDKQIQQYPMQLANVLESLWERNRSIRNIAS